MSLNGLGFLFDGKTLNSVSKELTHDPRVKIISFKIKPLGLLFSQTKFRSSFH